jgi:simple sugar transport system permease protein
MRPRDLRSMSKDWWPAYVLVFVWAVVTLVSPEFASLEFRDGRLYGSLVDVFNRSAPTALLALGMCLVIATGGIDLSVGAVIAISGAICANVIAAGSLSLPVIVLGGLAGGLAAGLMNASLVGLLGIQPIVATLVLMVAGRGVAQLINDGQIVTFSHAGFEYLGTGSVLGLPTPVVIVAITAVLLTLLVRRTALGLFIEAVGANPVASHHAGLNVRAIKFLVYTISGVCAAVAGMIVTADIQGADANNAGLWLELDAILAVVMGGAALAGGRFSLWLTLVGVLIIQSLTTGILLSGIPPQYNLLIKAIAILAVLLVQSPQLHRQLWRKRATAQAQAQAQAQARKARV